MFRIVRYYRSILAELYAVAPLRFAGRRLILSFGRGRELARSASLSRWFLRSISSRSWSLRPIRVSASSAGMGWRSVSDLIPVTVGIVRLEHTGVTHYQHEVKSGLRDAPTQKVPWTGAML